MKNVSYYLQKSIYVLFFLLFFITPFLFYPFTHFFPIPWILFDVDPQTNELFEFNKMFFVYGITILTTTLWLVRSLEEKRFIFKKTFLDYPLALFLLSQVLSTIFSIDVHTSIWGYYSRFHGGLLSSVCYALLYWCLVSNLFEKKYLHRLLNAMLLSSAVVAVYGICQHFGVDKDFWIQNVQARVFSSLGQPNWLAAFLVALIPVSISYFLFESRWYFKLGYLIISSVMFVCFLFTASRSGLLALVVALGFFASLVAAQRFTSVKRIIQIAAAFIFFSAVYTFIYYKIPSFAIMFSLASLVLAGFVLALVSSRANRIWLAALGIVFIIAGVVYSSPDSFRLGASGAAPSAPVKEIPQDAGGTETGTIRFIVWKGAWEIFKHYPVLGSGVESFAYSFYQYRPTELLRTTEWDFLYNKAHNEYFNILATTGLFGVIMYAIYVLSFFNEGWHAWKKFAGVEWKAPVEKIQIKVERAKKQFKTDLQTPAHLENPYYSFLMCAGLLSGFVTLLITNFFGFSVVNIALFFFLFPAFLTMAATRERFSLRIVERIRTMFPRLSLRETSVDWLHIGIYGVVIFSGMYLFSSLFNYWFADIRFAEGRLYNKQGEIGQAHKRFVGALELRHDEPYYYSELGWTEGEIIYTLMKDNDASSAAELVEVAETNAKTATAISPNNVLYWKKLADTYYNLSFYDLGAYRDQLKKAADRTRTLAPTDVSTLLVLSNYYERLGDIDTAVKIVSQSTEWKPDLAEAWNRLGELYYARYQKNKSPEDKDKANEYRFKSSQLDTTNEGYKKGFE